MRRVKNKEVLNFSNNHEKKFPKNVMLRIKSHSPNTLLPKDLTSWFKEHDIEVVNKRKGNKKYDAVFSGNYLESTMDFFKRFEQIHNSCKQDGFIVIDLPFSVNAGWFAYQPNLFKQLASQNNYDFVYFKVLDHSGLFPITFEHTKRLTDSTLSESLYKHDKTVNMRINVTFKKTTNEPFSFKDPE